MHHKGLLYTTFSEFFGSHDMRVPSIYWAIIATHPGSGLCKAARKKWGFIASQDGLALAYPVIAARDDGTAVVVYSFAGNVELDHSLGFAHPGEHWGVFGLAFACRGRFVGCMLLCMLLCLQLLQFILPDAACADQDLLAHTSWQS